MTSPRLTIARWMGLLAILAVNAALVRSFLVQGTFCGAVLIVMALQIGLYGLLCSRGRSRRFWWGFETCGMAAVLILFSCDFYPDSPLNSLVTSYTNIAADLAFTHLPEALIDRIDRNQDLLLAVVYFVPELAAALAGGVIAAFLVVKGLDAGDRPRAQAL